MKKIKILGVKLGQHQAKAILFLIYILLVPPFAVIAKLSQEKSFKIWSKWSLKSDSLVDVKKQN